MLRHRHVVTIAADLPAQRAIYVSFSMELTIRTLQLAPRSLPDGSYGDIF